MYFVFYVSRLVGFQEESSVDCVDSKISVQYIYLSRIPSGCDVGYVFCVEGITGDTSC